MRFKMTSRPYEYSYLSISDRGIHMSNETYIPRSIYVGFYVSNRYSNEQRPMNKYYNL